MPTNVVHSLYTLAFLAMAGSAATAVILPLKPGTYVLAGTPCADPAFAARFDYDGQRFSYPHASHCDSRILSHSGRTYKIQETCAALGDGAPAARDTETTTYTITSATHVLVSDQKGRTVIRYRWCAAQSR